MFSEKEKKNQQQHRSEKDEESITGGFARVRKLSSRWLNDLFGNTTTTNSNGSGGQRDCESLSNDVTTFECDNYNSNNDIMTTLNVGAIPKQKKKMKVRTEEEVEEDLEDIINMEDVTGMNELANYINLKGEQQQQPQKSNSFWVSSRSSSSRAAVLTNGKGALRSYNNNKQKQKKKTVFPSNYNCNSSRVNLPGDNDNYDNKDGPAKEEEERRQRDAGVAMKRDFSSNTSSSSDGRKYEALSLHPSLLYYHQSQHCYPGEVGDKDAGDLLHPYQEEQQQKLLPRNSSSTRHQKHEGSYYCHYQHEEERFYSAVQDKDKGQEGRQAHTPTPALLPSVASTTAGRKYGDMQTKVEEQQQQNYNHRRRQKQQRLEKSSGRSCRSTLLPLPGHANMSDCDNSSGGDEGGNNNNNNHNDEMGQRPKEVNGRRRAGGDSRQLNTCNNNNFNVSVDGQSFSRGNRMVQVDEKKPKLQRERKKKKTKKGKDKDSFDEDNNTCRLLDAPADGYLSVESSELDDVEGGGVMADNYGDSFDEDVEEGNNNERLNEGGEEEELQYFINHNNINQRDQVRSGPEDRGSSGWFARSLGKSRALVVNKNGLSGSDDNNTKKFYYSKIEIRE